MFLSFSYNGKEIKRELNESEHNTLHNTSQQWTRGERRTKWAKGKNHASFHSIVFFLLSHFLLSFFHLYLLRLVDSVPSLQAREGSAWMKEEQEEKGTQRNPSERLAVFFVLVHLLFLSFSEKELNEIEQSVHFVYLCSFHLFFFPLTAVKLNEESKEQSETKRKRASFTFLFISLGFFVLFISFHLNFLCFSF